MLNFKTGIVITLLIVSAPLSCASDEEPLTPIGVEGLAAYDESIPTQPFHTDPYYNYDSFESLIEDVDLMFTGRVTGYEEAVLTMQYLPESSDIYHVYDGVVFTVDELLAGELPTAINQVTVRAYSLLLDEDKSPLFRMVQSPRPLLREGIEQRNLADGPLYFVHVNKPSNPDSPYYSPNLYYFPANRGAVIVNDDGTLGSGLPVGNVPDNGYTLEHARIAAQLVKKGQNPE